MADPSPSTPPTERREAGASPADRPRRPVLWPTPENPDPAGRLAELRRDWQARLKPIDEAERAAVDAIVGTVRRRILLERAELRVLEGLAEGRVEPAMPSLATLARHAARIEKDRAAAERELRELYRLRPVPIPRPDLVPERLEWLAAHLRQRAIESAEALAALLAAESAAPAVVEPGRARRASVPPGAGGGPEGAAPEPVGAGERPRSAPSGERAAAPRVAVGAVAPPPSTVGRSSSPGMPRAADWLGSASAIAGLARALGPGG